MFKDKVAEAERNKAKYTFAVFKRLLKNQDIERIHSFLIQKGGLPSEINDGDIDTLLKIYLQHANSGYIKKLLHLISNDTSSPFDLVNDEQETEKFTYN
uniref:Uncharacterized protein n=1 Tax=Panagrolaimus superbus TaxID=310955 RepID=A0A914YBX1_9BILA